MKLQTTQSISIAHFVQTTKSSSPCQRLHGHTLKIQISIDGEVQKDGMIADFRDIKEIIKSYDHKIILPKSLIVVSTCGRIDFLFEDTLQMMSSENYKVIDYVASTCECIAQDIKHEIEELIPSHTKITVRIYESETSYVET